jgi:hypothetical protein
MLILMVSSLIEIAYLNSQNMSILADQVREATISSLRILAEKAVIP